MVFLQNLFNGEVQMSNNIWDTVFFVLFSATVLVAWGYWVHQRDAFLNEVMDCMTDMSEEEYNRCADVVRG
jgi:hypothetical protein